MFKKGRVFPRFAQISACCANRGCGRARQRARTQRRARNRLGDVCGRCTADWGTWRVYWGTRKVSPYTNDTQIYKWIGREKGGEGANPLTEWGNWTLMPGRSGKAFRATQVAPIRMQPGRGSVQREAGQNMCLAQINLLEQGCALTRKSDFARAVFWRPVLWQAVLWQAAAGLGRAGRAGARIGAEAAAQTLAQTAAQMAAQTETRIAARAGMRPIAVLGRALTCR